jgi:hypothetical protein
MPAKQALLVVPAHPQSLAPPPPHHPNHHPPTHHGQLENTVLALLSLRDLSQFSHNLSFCKESKEKREIALHFFVSFGQKKRIYRKIHKTNQQVRKAFDEQDVLHLYAQRKPK